MPNQQHCKNCNASLSGDARFCYRCGQSTTSYARPFLSFVQQSIHELLDIDGRIALTLRTLLLKPGLASYEFSQGKRVKYTPPLRLYLVASLVFFFVFASFQHVYTSETSQPASAVETYSRAMFVLFPLFALFVKCFFWNSYYMANLVFSMHIHSVGYVVLMIIGPLEALEKTNEVFTYLQIIPSCYFFWYLLEAFKTMYRQSWLKTVFKAFGVYFVYMAALGLVFDVALGV